jgi:beta-lactam-binding protein with PASTA domain
VVPKVVGKRVASARLTIARRHCRTGKLDYAYSRKHKKGIVISQSRRPGRVLPARSKIDLVVSRGRRR